MSEYWKSNPRKFCDFCKCWIADNKPSVEFHERGKRHKENVQKRLAEMGRKGQEEYEAKLQEEDFLKAMEEAALKAYKTDIEHNPDMMGTKISEFAKANNAELVVGKKKETSEKIKESDKNDVKEGSSKPKVKMWHEVKAPDGQSYYWNTSTGDTKWEPPEEGYLSLTEQKELKNKKKKTNKTSTSESKTSNAGNGSNKSGKNFVTQQTKPGEQETTSLSSEPVLFGPAPKAQAYSSWQTLQKEPEHQPVDLQLPQLSVEEYSGPELSFKNPESSFEEKTVSLGSKETEEGGTSSVGFKKRKAAPDNRKLMKRRNDL